MRSATRRYYQILRREPSTAAPDSLTLNVQLNGVGDSVRIVPQHARVVPVVIVLRQSGEYRLILRLRRQDE